MDRKRDSRSRDARRDAVQSSSAAADKSRMRMDSYDRSQRQRASPPRRKEIDNVMKKARRDGAVQSQYWNKKLLEVEEKDPNRWRHSGYKELYGDKSSSRSRSRSPVPTKKTRTGPRSPPVTSSRNKSSGGGARGRPHTPPSKPSGSRPKSPASVSGSESFSSCSDESCSVCSPKHGKKKSSARSRSRSFSVPRSRPTNSKQQQQQQQQSTAKSSGVPARKPTAVKDRRGRDNSPPRDPRGPPPSPPRVRQTAASGGKRKPMATVKIEGQPKKKRIIRPGSPPAESDSDDSSTSSVTSGAAAPKLTLSERFGKMAQWSVDRRDIDSVKNMRITKDSDSTDFKVVIEGPDEDEHYRTSAPEFDRRFGEGYFPETMHAAPNGLDSWDDVRVRYKYYKGRGYLRDLTLDDYMKWEEWWYKYQEWLEAERYYEHWANIRARHHKRRYAPK